MKKVYLQPSIYLHTLKFESEVLTGTREYNGTAGETHYGGNTEVTENPEHQKDVDPTPVIPGTGDDTGFTHGAPINKRTY